MAASDEWSHEPSKLQYLTPRCAECSDTWPCDAERMRLRAERVEAALQEAEAIIRLGTQTAWLRHDYYGWQDRACSWLSRRVPVRAPNAGERWTRYFVPDAERLRTRLVRLADIVDSYCDHEDDDPGCLDSLHALARTIRQETAAFAAPSVPSIDADRLARAMWQAMPLTPEYHSLGSWREAAQMVAAEYEGTDSE